MKQKKTHTKQKDPADEFARQLLQLRDLAVRNRKKARGEAEHVLPAGINREMVLAKMAAHLTGWFYMDMPAQKKEQVSTREIRARALGLLKSGMDADMVTDRLSEEFGGE